MSDSTQILSSLDLAWDSRMTKKMICCFELSIV